MSAFVGDREAATWEASANCDEDLKQRVYRTIQNLPLPKESKRCSPDMEANGLSTSHALEIAVTVKEPDNRTLKDTY
ncbi:glucose-methanol-choline oxidoreductase:GMC oxidoreductase [Colletotrichum tofieldiae]|nr:glucose-methanol-choline oxidoreductase:GMC oxidoreductase [Colletotrichum tofieldiae]